MLTALPLNDNKVKALFTLWQKEHFSTLQINLEVIQQISQPWELHTAVSTKGEASWKTFQLSYKLTKCS